MSVVNKMLQDLEARKVESEFNVDYQAPGPKRATSWVWLLLVLFIVVAIWFGYRFFISAQIPHLQVDNVPQQQLKVAIAQDLNNVDNNVDTHLKNNVDSHPNKDYVDSHPKNSQPKNNVNYVDTHVKNNAQNNVNNMDSHPKNGHPKNAHPNNVDTHPTIIEENQQSVTAKKPLQVADMLISQQSNNPQRVNKNNSLPVKVKVNSTGNNLEQATIVQKQQPMNEVFAVKTSREVATEADISQQIQVALKRGDDHSAIALLEKLLTVAPSNLKARKRLAAMLFSQGEHDQANNVLQQGIVLQPDNRDLRLMQARLYVQMKNPDKAHELLANYAISADQSVDFISYRAALAQRLDRFSDAQKDYFQLTQNQPANAKWWLGLAVAEERLGNKNLALSAYQNAKQLAQLSLEVDKFVDQRIHYLAGVN